MRNIRALIVLFITVFLFPSYSYAFEDGDFQYWNTESISWKIAKDYKMTLEEEFRFGDDMTDFYYQHTDFGVTYSGLCEWLDLGINYRFIFEEKDNDWKYENRPHANATLKFELGNINFSTRNRFEYRDKENKDPIWRYRNKFTIKLPKLTPLEIQPYIADEIFVDFDEEELNRNRLYGGISLKLWKGLKGEIYYLWQSSESNDKWTDCNVLGTKLNLSF